ncbi:hypothetical protein EYC80_008273 [Monilinia laxa]|uniref:Uncharacterized protein n=1 Tax=Monilinia laxa TaxID=61186 RepID=A0A5N6JV59_MONLA|nr:hypothetical protein EYC80_008273 [Monilinia laxa]
MEFLQSPDYVFIDSIHKSSQARPSRGSYHIISCRSPWYPLITINQHTQINSQHRSYKYPENSSLLSQHFRSSHRKNLTLHSPRLTCIVSPCHLIRCGFGVRAGALRFGPERSMWGHKIPNPGAFFQSTNVCSSNFNSSPPCCENTAKTPNLSSPDKSTDSDVLVTFSTETLSHVLLLTEKSYQTVDESLTQSFKHTEFTRELPRSQGQILKPQRFPRAGNTIPAPCRLEAGVGSTPLNRN